MKSLLSMVACAILAFGATSAHAGLYPACSSEDWQMGTCFGYTEYLQAQAQSIAEAEAAYGEAALAVSTTTVQYWAGAAFFGVITTVTFDGGGGYQCEVVWQISPGNGTLAFDHISCYGV